MIVLVNSQVRYQIRRNYDIGVRAIVFSYVHILCAVIVVDGVDGSSTEVMRHV